MKRTELNYAMPIEWQKQWKERYGTIDSRQIKTPKGKDPGVTVVEPPGESAPQETGGEGSSPAEKKPVHTAQRVLVTF